MDGFNFVLFCEFALIIAITNIFTVFLQLFIYITFLLLKKKLLIKKNKWLVIYCKQGYNVSGYFFFDRNYSKIYDLERLTMSIVIIESMTCNRPFWGMGCTHYDSTLLTRVSLTWIPLHCVGLGNICCCTVSEMWTL